MALDCTKGLNTKSREKRVKNLQSALKTLGLYTKKLDYNYGKYTKAGVLAFQKKYPNELPQTGLCDPATCKKINEVIAAKKAEQAKKTTTSGTTTTTSTASTILQLNCKNIYLKKGKKGQQVHDLQVMLQKLGYYLDCKVDSDFGSETKKAVKAFQTKHGLKDDGEVGPVTCPVLNKKYKEKVEAEAKAKAQAEANAKKTTTTTTKKEEIKPSKYNVLPKHKANLIIDDVYFIIISWSASNSFKTGEWQQTEMMGDGVHTSKGHKKPRSFEVECAFYLSDYRQIVQAFNILMERTCKVTSSVIPSSNYVCTFKSSPRKGLWMTVNITLLEVL